MTKKTLTTFFNEKTFFFSFSSLLAISAISAH